MTENILPIAVTMGDPAGIGGETTLKSWLNHRANLPPFFILDSPARLASLAESLHLEINLAEIGTPIQAGEIFKKSLPVLPIDLPEKCVPGVLNAGNGSAVKESIERAVSYVQDGEASAIVTNPIHKSSLYQSGFPYPGHTEFLAALAGIETEPVMMLAADNFRVVPVTKHVGLHEAIEILTPEMIVETAAITSRSLIEDFGIEKPRLAIAALNPHAGEDGAMGSEEAKLIVPAIEQLKGLAIDVTGPHPSDTLFHPAAQKKYDVVLGMYHDQVLIPIKTVAFDHAVNITLGLPFVRTSPDHGTALDIAGQGVANEKSLLAALQMAARMVESRRSFDGSVR